jgi:hypothetical protein
LAFHAVVIQGRSRHEVPGQADETTLEPSSYFGSEGDVTHRLTCEAGEGCLVYVRTDEAFDVAVGAPGE